MPDSDTDWKAAGESALTVALGRAEELARECGDLKQLDGIIKTLGEIVGTGLVLGGKSGSRKGGDDDERDDDD